MTTSSGLFQEYYETLEKFEEADADAVYDLLDAFPTYFQRAEAHTEQVLTTWVLSFAFAKPLR